MASRDGAEPVSGEGTSSIAVELADGSREVCVNRIGFTLAAPAPGVTVGNLAGTSRGTVPADSRESRRFLFGVAQELRRQHGRNRPLPPPQPKPMPSGKRPKWEAPVPCPACTGDDPWCDICEGTGAVSKEVARRWRELEGDDGSTPPTPSEE